MGTTERALTSMKTRETKKQKREGAEYRVQELKKKTPKEVVATKNAIC